MDKHKIAITAICGAVGAGLGYIGYKKYSERTEGDTADCNTSHLEESADTLGESPENAFVPTATEEDADPVSV